MDDLTGREALVHACTLKNGRILDVGLGSCGCMALFLAKRGFQVVGIDHSRDAVAEARRNAAQQRFRGAFEAKVADARKLPFAEEEFDGITAYHSLHDMSDVEKVIDEMFRVCRRDGCIIISDLNDKGRRAYGHEPDNGTTLDRILNCLLRHTRAIQRIDTEYDVIFVCKKSARKASVRNEESRLRKAEMLRFADRSQESR